MIYLTNYDAEIKAILAVLKLYSELLKLILNMIILKSMIWILHSLS